MKKLCRRYIPVLRSVIYCNLAIITNNTSQEEKETPSSKLSILKCNICDIGVIVVEVSNVTWLIFTPFIHFYWVHIDDSGSNSEQPLQQCHMAPIEGVLDARYSARCLYTLRIHFL